MSEIEKSESIWGNDIPETLEGMAARINQEHQLVEQAAHSAEQAAHSALEHAYRAGELLFLAKTDIKHGDFTPWVKENFVGSVRTAQAYIRVYKKWDRLERRNAVADLSDLPLRGALKELSEPRSQKPKPIKVASPPTPWVTNKRKASDAEATADAAGDTIETVTFEFTGATDEAIEAPRPSEAPPAEPHAPPAWFVYSAVRNLAGATHDPEELAKAWFERGDMKPGEVYKAKVFVSRLAAAMEAVEKKSKGGDLIDE